MPTVLLVSEKFKALAEMEAEALEMPGIRKFVLPHPIGTLSDDELRALARESVEQIERLLLEGRD